MDASLLVANVRRIAVLRASAMGDFVYALPALEALRAAYPTAEIVLLGRAWHAAWMAGRESPVDRVIELPAGIPGDGRRGLPPDQVGAILEPIAAEGWDLALQLHGGGRHSNPVVRALRARVSAGCRAEDAPELDRWIRYVYYQSEVVRALEVVGLVGATPVTLDPRLCPTPADRTAAREAAPGVAGRRYAVLHPGASDPRRRWPVAKFSALGDTLAERGLTVVVTGTPEAEGEIVASVVAGMGAPALDLTGRLDFPALVGLLAGAEVVVGNDTGPLHLATAVGTPVVGIYWCGNVINGGTPLRERHRPAISWRTACPDCGADCTVERCPHEPSFVADVPVETVAHAALDLLAGREGPGEPAQASLTGRPGGA